MQYRLAVLTHGGGPYLARSLATFAAYVTPSPTDVVIYRDGGAVSPDEQTFTLPRLRVVAGTQEGFCGATRRLWDIAASPGPPLVFWLEHDFVFTRPVDLRGLATVLTANPQLAQVALMRDAANAQEREAGGLYESRPGQYVARVESVARASLSWLEHTSYFTTNPSLMLRSFMQTNPWPDYDRECEGRFGIDLRAQGFSFAVMGDGQPWVRHEGVRSGFGY